MSQIMFKKKKKCAMTFVGAHSLSDLYLHTHGDEYEPHERAWLAFAEHQCSPNHLAQWLLLTDKPPVRYAGGGTQVRDILMSYHG